MVAQKDICKLMQHWKERKKMQDHQMISRVKGLYRKPSGGLLALILFWVHSNGKNCRKLSTFTPTKNVLLL